MQPSWGGLRPCPGPSEGAHRRPQGSSKRAPTRLCAIPRTQLFTSWGRAWSRRGALLEPSWVPPLSFPWPSGGPKTATRHLQEGPKTALCNSIWPLAPGGGSWSCLGATLGAVLWALLGHSQGSQKGLKGAPRRLYAIEFAPEVAIGAPMSSNGTVRRSPREPPERDGITRRSGRRGLRARGAGAARSEGKQ